VVEKAEESCWPRWMETVDRRVDLTHQRMLSMDRETIGSTVEGEVGGRQHALCAAFHATARVSHAPTSKIYSRVHEGHTPACGGRKNMLLKTARSEGTHEHCGGARLMINLPENDGSNFKKDQIRNLQKECVFKAEEDEWGLKPS
jgi:hypothetical protein